MPTKLHARQTPPTAFRGAEWRQTPAPPTTYAPKLDQCDARHNSAKRKTGPIPEGANADDLARLCAVSERTARRWRAQKRMPAILSAWVSAATGGDLGGLDASWRGWRLVRGELYGPDLAHGFKPGDVLAIPYVRALVKSYQNEQRLPRQADFISGLFEPARELTNEKDSQESSSFPDPAPRRAWWR